VRIKDFILDLIFPKFCLGCGQEGGAWLCWECLKKILPVQTQVCPACGKIAEQGKFCRPCRVPSLSGIIVAGYYEEGSLKEIIHNFKYNAVRELGELLGTMMTTSLEENFSMNKDFLITAVPLHFLRRAKRGYNQSEILAEIIASRLNLEKNFKTLYKFRGTTAQVQTSGKERLKNIKNSFKINKKIRLSGRRIILVDDVATTGATLQECARLLKKAGAKEVWGLVAAKG